MGAKARQRSASVGTPESASAALPIDVEKEVGSFVAEFDPDIAKNIRACRKALRSLFPTAYELVYNNYNFFVIGYSPTGRPSHTVVSLAAAANGVVLSFYRGATLPDPDRLLLGDGTQSRFVRLPNAQLLSSAPIRVLMQAAVAQATVPFAATGGGHTVIRSVSEKQRSRRKSHAA